MSIQEQYAIDTWRLRGAGQAEPPAPGSHEAKLLRAWWVARREAKALRDGTGGAASPPASRWTSRRTSRRLRRPPRRA
ncbi:hypothetical protein [Streptomyces iconiensis]|uniref:Uncharacterized protein n=1 Tax=Streptomyces iconiensis TaxID=1384038 RepID=A0ABT6ZSE5_9ACTN|nr:hypothetical protein [Streptomyces iconiensis]MDJ1131978.1 hypothetical protein [Streptomyces iconiensis]